MINKILIVIFILSGILVFSGVSAVSAYDFEESSGLKTTAADAGYEISDAETIDSKIGIIIKSVLSFLGVLFFVLMVYGGFLWMTAKGNEQQLEKAKNLITAAIIGLIVVVSSYAISYFIIGELGGETLKSG